MAINPQDREPAPGKSYLILGERKKGLFSLTGGLVSAGLLPSGVMRGTDFTVLIPDDSCTFCDRLVFPARSFVAHFSLWNPLHAKRSRRVRRISRAVRFRNFLEVIVRVRSGR